MNAVSFSQRWLVPTIIILVMVALTISVGWNYGQGNPDSANPIVVGAAAIALVVVIFRQPFWGLGLVIATLPIVDTLPKLPLVTSLFPIIGLATLAAFIYQRHRAGLSIFPQRFNSSYAFGAAFVLWIFISNPEAALRAGRGVALLTYFQLLVLLWMSGELLTDVSSNRKIMWLYVASCLLSAYYAIQDTALGETFSTEGKSGLGGISSSARQFAVALIVLFFLRNGLKRYIQRGLIIITWAAQIMLLYGIATTGSRTGVLIVAIGVFVILLAPTSKIRPQRIIMPGIVIFTIYFAVPSSYWDSLWNSIFPAIEEGSDTVGTRYELWATAMRMVEDKPITGVGINQFIPNVLQYSDPLSSTVVVTGAHSIYFSVIAETGVIGLALYAGMLVSSLIYALRAAFVLRENEQASLLAFTWFTALVIILVGGITKQDQYDKLLWFVLGACAAMEQLRHQVNQKHRSLPVQWRQVTAS
ncbi:MAG: O-antigen ligase family protein [Chloroflexi bacterium]|nr:O-antigen ligase family protein [Chloroflexota bacterium]